jgi:hypothetical protein
MIDARRISRGGAAALMLAVVLAGCGDQQKAVAEREQAEAKKAAEAGTTADEKTTATNEPAPAVETTHTYTLPSGTTMVGTLENTINSGKNQVGDPFRLHTVAAEHVDGATVVPAGSTIRGHVTYVNGAGRVAGGAELTLRFTDLVLPDGTTYPISAAPLRMHGKGDAKESALEIGGGAVAGGILGGILGHGSGDVAKGAAAGAVVGTGVAVATKGDQIVLSPGQRIRVTLDAPVRVTRTRSAS